MSLAADLRRIAAATQRILALVVLLLGFGAAAASPAAAAPGGPYAMHSMLQLNSPYEFKQAMFSAAAAAGASEIRVDLSLGALNNPWISTSMWQGLSDYMQLSQKYDLPVLVDLNSYNDLSLETCAPGASVNCGVTDLAGYYSEIATLVQHTRGVIDDFEIVNEPDGSWAFSGSPQQYAAMLSTAYQAVHDNDPNGRVLLGGIMTPGDQAWLTQVFVTPGWNAAHKFDIANVHLRDNLASLPGDLIGWEHYFQFFGDGSVPLWVTETGYPADPAYQYDPAFRGTDPASGQAQQAAYLAKALPELLFAGAARVFVTEHDTMTGQFASEGLLAGGGGDPGTSGPDPVPRPALTVFQSLAAQAAAAPAAPPAALPPPPSTPVTVPTTALASAPSPPAGPATTRPAAAPAPTVSTEPAPAKPAPTKPVAAKPVAAKPVGAKARPRRRAAGRRPRKARPARIAPHGGSAKQRHRAARTVRRHDRRRPAVSLAARAPARAGDRA